MKYSFDDFHLRRLVIFRYDINTGIKAIPATANKKRISNMIIVLLIICSFSYFCRFSTIFVTPRK